MSIKAIFFARNARKSIFIGDRYNLLDFAYLNSPGREAYDEALLRVNNAADDETGPGASAADVLTLVRFNVEEWKDPAEAARLAANEKVKGLVEQFPNDQFFVITDKDSPDCYTVEEVGVYQRVA